MLVAVYGTLKKGYGNHDLLSRSDAEYVGEGLTGSRYNMYSMGGFPSVALVDVDSPAPKTRVSVEVYNLTDIAPLDRLEGYPAFYNRTEIPVRVEGKYIMCWIYHIDRPTGALVEGGCW